MANKKEEMLELAPKVFSVSPENVVFRSYDETL